MWKSIVYWVIELKIMTKGGRMDGKGVKNKTSMRF